MLYTCCVSSKPFSPVEVPAIVAEIERRLASSSRYKLSHNFRARWSTLDPPSFLFVVPRPVSFACFNPKWLNETTQVSFNSKLLLGNEASILFARIFDYVCSSMPTMSVLCSLFCNFDDGHPAFRLELHSNSIRADLRPLTASEELSPKVLCQCMNQQVRALATVVKLEPLYVVDDNAVRWQGKSNEDVYVVALFAPDVRGDPINVKIPISKASQVSKAAAKFIAKANSHVVVNAQIIVPTSEMEQYLKAGPFEDGYLNYQIESTIAKSVQKSLTGLGAPFIGFCPAYDYIDRKGHNFLVCFQADESSAECIIGISNEEEQLNSDVFRAFVKKAGLSRIFPE